jgi:hydrogenase maturation protease
VSRVLVGGVGYRWQRDASFGVVAADELAKLSWPEGTDVLDLGYGAIYAAQDMGDADPPYEKAVLLAGVGRGRPRGRLFRRRWRWGRTSSEEVQERIREAGAGVIHPDHLLVIAEHFGTLPRDVVLLEVEPMETGPGEELSGAVADLLPEVFERVRREVSTRCEAERAT